MKFYINLKNDNPGYHNEVHSEDCRYLPDSYNRRYLGEFSDGIAAVLYARNMYPNADGCAFCCPEAHRG